MPLKTHLDEQPGINLTPMIDVVFLLIIFFMVGTKFAEMERSIGLQIPEVSDQGVLKDPPPALVVNVYSDGELTLDRKSVSLQELGTELQATRQEHPATSVVVRGDGKTSYQRIAEVMNVCRQAGIKDLGMAVRLEP
ncbi:Biopolymer transport protein ExbD [Planctomycetales bacterium 10988]|nr:Biopolymer transport protein ExbD [Planctomycetales bacterium 10988]